MVAARGATSWKSKVPNKDPRSSQARGRCATKVPPRATIRPPPEATVIGNCGELSVASDQDLWRWFGLRVRLVVRGVRIRRGHTRRGLTRRHAEPIEELVAPFRIHMLSELSLAGILFTRTVLLGCGSPRPATRRNFFCHKTMLRMLQVTQNSLSFEPLSAYFCTPFRPPPSFPVVWDKTSLKGDWSIHPQKPIGAGAEK